MTYVDASIWPFGRMMMCHLSADTLEELHAMADKVGISRRHFQSKPGSLPHYDLCKSFRSKAVRLGAKEVNREEMGRVIQQWREKTMSKPKTENYQACTFRAATNAGPLKVEGHFLMLDGLAIVLHRGYGADKDSPLLFASEYASGIEIARGKRSALLADVAERIRAHGGAKNYVKALSEIIRSHKKGLPTDDGEWRNNSALLPEGY